MLTFVKGLASSCENSSKEPDRIERGTDKKRGTQQNEVLACTASWSVIVIETIKTKVDMPLVSATQCSHVWPADRHLSIRFSWNDTILRNITTPPPEKKKTIFTRNGVR